VIKLLGEVVELEILLSQLVVARRDSQQRRYQEDHYGHII
jgi:hypothetical protein